MDGWMKRRIDREVGEGEVGVKKSAVQFPSSYTLAPLCETSAQAEQRERGRRKDSSRLAVRIDGCTVDHASDRTSNTNETRRGETG